MPTKKPATKKKTTTRKTTAKKTETVVEKEKTTISTPGGKYFYAAGKRKTSSAQVRLYKGKGIMTVNNKPINEYFALKSLIANIKSPLKITGTLDRFDITVQVKGGGINSQADAIRHGISKALLEADPLLRPTLKKMGMLTRDSRIKERKKFGLKRARRGPQFSKR